MCKRLNGILILIQDTRRNYAQYLRQGTPFYNNNIDICIKTLHYKFSIQILSLPIAIKFFIYLDVIVQLKNEGVSMFTEAEEYQSYQIPLPTVVM